MPEEPLIAVQTTQIAIEAAQRQQLVEPPAPATAEQTRAVDGVFTHESKEAAAVAGLLTAQMGLLVLHDIAVDTLTPSRDEEEEKKEKPGKPTSTEG